MFLDSTLERVIKRFEDEFPECREVIPAAGDDVEALSDTMSESGSLPTNFTNPFPGKLEASDSAIDQLDADEDGVVRTISRHNSDVSLASRTLGLEEGRMHRFGQQIRRELLRPQTLDHAHGTTGTEFEAKHLRQLREQLESLDGAAIKEKVEGQGADAVLRELGTTLEELAFLGQEDPESFEKFRESQIIAVENVTRAKEGSPSTGT
jgi:hypothetical protein